MAEKEAVKEKVIDLSLGKEEKSAPAQNQARGVSGEKRAPQSGSGQKQAPKPSQVAIPPRPISNQTAGRNGKIRMEDVKYVPKLSGPIDELGDMDLTNFRRLNEDPTAAARKIKEKIEFLEDDGYAKRLEGIKAWRECPVNKLYLSLGEKSINENKSIDNIISEGTSQGEEVLSKKEFIAIMELNKDLRF